MDEATNTEIAESMGITVGAVQFHVTNIYGKLGVRKRTEAIVQEVRRGLVVIDE